MLTREQMELEAARRTEANIYSLTNRYLSEGEKLETEIWFQSPGDFMLYAFTALSLINSWHPMRLSVLVGVPVFANLLVGLINWFLYPRRLLWILYRTVFHNVVQWILLLAASGLLLYTGHFWLAGAIVLWKLGVLSIFELHMVLFAFLSKPYRMHPKYALHKRQYGRRYPFEEPILAEQVMERFASRFEDSDIALRLFEKLRESRPEEAIQLYGNAVQFVRQGRDFFVHSIDLYETYTAEYPCYGCAHGDKCAKDSGGDCPIQEERTICVRRVAVDEAPNEFNAGS